MRFAGSGRSRAPASPGAPRAGPAHGATAALPAPRPRLHIGGARRASAQNGGGRARAALGLWGERPASGQKETSPPPQSLLVRLEAPLTT